jgi:hypothetical protein
MPSSEKDLLSKRINNERTKKMRTEEEWGK